MKEVKEINILEKYNKNISPEIKQVLSFIGKFASRNNIKAYLIGGIVRDIILEKNGFDIDITLEADAIEFAKKLEKEYKNCFLKESHEDFKTAKVIFETKNTDIEIDLASTRKESYREPACLPMLEKHACPINEDVKRRDFTINALAMSLNSENFGNLIDCLNGFEDLNKKELKILHKNSFIDDPTRILRMLKFSIRFDFNYEKQTKSLMNEALNYGKFDNLGTERIKLELKQTFNLNSEEAFDRIIDENIYKLINTGIEPFTKGQNIQKTINCFNIEKENIWLVYLACLVCTLEKKEVVKTAESLNLNNFEKKVLQDAKWLFENTKEFKSNYEVYKFFKGKEKESIIAFGIKNKNPAKNYLEKLAFIQIETTGNDLIKKGVKQGKEIGIILEKLLEAKLNGKIQNLKDEKDYLVFLAKKK